MNLNKEELLSKVSDRLPDIGEFLSLIGPLPASYEGETMSIQEFATYQAKWVEEVKEQSNQKKFLEFISNLLFVQVRSEVVERAIREMKGKYKHISIDSLSYSNPKDLERTLREVGYRFPSRAKILIEVARIIRDKFSGNMDEYASFATTNYENDPLLEIKGIGYKVRDWALSHISTASHCVVDVHIRNVLRNTGLVVYGYLYNIPLSTDRTTDEEYKHIRDLLDKFSEITSLEPLILDQFLWFFGKDYCSKKKCNMCKVERCMSR